MQQHRIAVGGRVKSEMGSLVSQLMRECRHSCIYAAFMVHTLSWLQGCLTLR
jgi:hypothetical protein